MTELRWAFHLKGPIFQSLKWAKFSPLEASSIYSRAKQVASRKNMENFREKIKSSTFGFWRVTSSLALLLLRLSIAPHDCFPQQGESKTQLSRSKLLWYFAIESKKAFSQCKVPRPWHETGHVRQPWARAGPRALRARHRPKHEPKPL